MQTPMASTYIPVALLLIGLSAGTLDAAEGPYTVRQGRIMSGHVPIRLFGVNWFGFETTDHVVHGLWARNYVDMIEQMRSLGFTAVRLPFCPETLANEPVHTVNTGLNPSLAGLGGLEALDEIVTELDEHGLYIVLDHHKPSDSGGISPLWYTEEYSEQEWIEDLCFVADRYRHIEHFLAVDLKNEPHGDARWGTGQITNDWRLAAERAAEAVLAANSNILVFVGGIENNHDCSSGLPHYWGENLEPQRCYPLRIDSSKLVLSPHVYGPDVAWQTYFADPSFPTNMPPIWDRHFGFLSTGETALVIGEFGGKYGHDGGHPLDVPWQNALIDYFIESGIYDTFVWSWNANSGDTGGILSTSDWQTVVQDKYDNLRRLMDAPAMPLHLGLSGDTPARLGFFSRLPYRYRLEESTDMRVWADTGASFTGANKTVFHPLPPDPADRRFLRLQRSPRPAP